MNSSQMLSNFGDHLNVVVVGASGGIGRGFIEHLMVQDNVARIFGFSRKSVDFSSDKVVSGALDYVDETSIEKASQQVLEAGPIDLVIVATGVLHDGAGLTPEKALRNISTENFEKSYLVNTIGPALVAKHFLPHLQRDSRSVFAALSARVGSISDNGLGGWYAYRAAKAALNMVIKNAAIEIGRRNKEAVIVGLHPGTVNTALSQPFQGNVKEGKLFTPEYSVQKMLSVINMLTLGQSGRVFDYQGAEIEP